MARMNRSVEKMKEALVQQLAEHPFSEITVSEICRSAGISRITFYRNFNTREELLRSYVNSVAEKIEAIVSKSPEAQALPTYFRLLFREVAAYSVTIRRIYEAELGEMILTAFNSALFRTPRQKNGVFFTTYQCRFYTGAFCNVFSQWLLSGQKETPEEMASLCCEMIH